MEDKKENKSSFPLPVILLISTFIAGGVFKYYAPLDSMRPAHNERRTEFHSGEEKVLARMWQDPFQAVENHLQSLKWEEGHSDAPSGFQPTLDLKDKRILIMPVLTTAGNYAENIEKRLRSRYALLSALHVAGYRSKKATHIGVFNLKELEEKKAEVELKTAEDIRQQAKEKVKQLAEELRFIGEKLKNAEFRKEESMEKSEASEENTQRIVDNIKRLAYEHRSVDVKLKKAKAEIKDSEEKLKIVKDELGILKKTHIHPIPYEWFISDPLDIKEDQASIKNKYDNILVLWLADEYLPKNRIEGFSVFFEDIKYSIESSAYSIKVGKNSVGWLNALLSIPNLYDILHNKKKEYDNEIKNLVDETKGYRNKENDNLNLEEQRKIQRLNRLLLEETYHEYAPKMQKRKRESEGSSEFTQDEFIPPYFVNRLCNKIEILQLDLKIIGPSHSVALEKMYTEANNLINRLAQKKDENDLNNERIKGIEEKINNEDQIHGNVHTKFKIIKDKLESGKSRNESACEHLRKAEESLKKTEGQVSQIYKKYKLEKSKNELSKELINLDGELNRKRSELGGLEKELNDAKNRLTKLRAESDGLYNQKEEKVTEEIQQQQQQQVSILDLYIDDLYEKRVDLEKKISNVTYEIADKNEIRNSTRKDITQIQKDYGIVDSRLKTVKEELLNLQNIVADMSFKTAKDGLELAQNHLTETENNVRALTIDYNKVKDAKESLDKLQKIGLQIQETISEIKNERERGFVMYSPWATADPFLLFLKESESVREIVRMEEKLQTKSKGKDIVSEILKETGIVLIRSIHTDQQLTDELVNELVRRGVKLRDDSSDHIVLISEWDTSYGRALPLSFAISIEKYRERNPTKYEKKSNLINNSFWPERIHKLTYMRGIDGMLPNKHNDSDSSVSKTTRTSQKKDNSSNMGYFTPEFKQPLGQAQYDYMRRLVEVIKQLPLNDPNGKSGDKVRAIGVLGSDIYDKLLILRALRGEFPNAIFFTNDMDARLYHHTELPWTRNLIVVSSYGLQLHRDLQRDIPPFRNVYQSSLFIAALQALGVKGDIDFKQIRPRIFEIGRNGPYDITPTLEMSSDSEFFIDEFMPPLSVKKLCEKIISEAYKIHADRNSIEWLNEFLRFPGFYDNLLEKKPDVIRKIMNGNIVAKLKMQRLDIKRLNNLKTIIEETKGYRDKSYYVLNFDERRNVKRLNRLLLEESYPGFTPKIYERTTNIPDKQMKIKRLNRLLIEETFPENTPKIHAGKTTALHPDRYDLWRNNSNQKEFWLYIIFMFCLPFLFFGWLIYRRLHDIKSTDQFQKWKELKGDFQLANDEVKQFGIKKIMITGNKTK